MIRIMASVSGGGARQSWLKFNGEIRELESLAEAKQVAAELNARMKGRLSASKHSQSRSVSKSISGQGTTSVGLRAVPASALLMFPPNRNW
jgi:hypothetical protein